MSHPHPLLIGAHVSIAGGLHNAPYRGKEIGATTIQIFTSNQKQWKGRQISDEEISLWKEAIDATQIQSVMSHDSYLINLGSPNGEMLEKSRMAFKEEIERCHKLDLTYLNFHPGSATGSTEEECLETIIDSLLKMEHFINKGKTMILLEATAGQGTNVGHRFEHLAYILEKTHQEIPIGVCIDTCHIFAAGYDIRTYKNWDQVLNEFDNIVGLKHLKAFHLNDSKCPLGSRKDRHASLGEGEIGIDCFKYLMTSEKTKDLPKYLETPLGDEYWAKEIKLLKEFAKVITYAH